MNRIFPGVITMPLQIRRGTNAERTAMTQALAAGELLYVTDTQRIYVGNGSTLGGIAVTGYTDGDAKDAAAAIFTGGTHTGISFTYDTALNTMAATVDLSSFMGNITASSLKGSVFADDSSIMVDAVDQKIYASGGFTGNLTGNVTGNLTGNVSGNVTGNVSGNVTGNLTGNVTGNLTGYHTGDMTGSVFADDSTIMVDGITHAITATGGLTAVNIYSDNIFADDSGIGLNVKAKTGNSFSTNYYNGTRDVPTAISAGSNVGAVSIKGFNGTTYAFAGAINAAWDATANTATDYPASTVSILAGNNTSSPVAATFDKEGTFEAPILKVGSYDNTGEAAITGSIGMIIYNTTTNKFRGYSNAGWVDLS